MSTPTKVKIQSEKKEMKKPAAQGNSGDIEAIRNLLGSTTLILTKLNVDIRTLFVRVIKNGGLELLRSSMMEGPSMDQMMEVLDSLASTTTTKSMVGEFSPGTTGSSSRGRKRIRNSKMEAKKEEKKDPKKFLKPKLERYPDDDDFSTPVRVVSRRPQPLRSFSDDDFETPHQKVSKRRREIHEGKKTDSVNKPWISDSDILLYLSD